MAADVIDPSTAPETAYVNRAKGSTKTYHFNDGSTARGRARAVARIKSIRQSRESAERGGK